MSDSPPLNCIQGIKRMLVGSSPQMRAIFETGANLSKLSGGEKAFGPEKKESQAYMLQLLPLRLYDHSKKVQNPR